MPTLRIHTVSAEQGILLLMLKNLGIAANLSSHQMLCIGVPRFAVNPNQGLTKELYPYIAEQCNATNWESVERSIRYAIAEGWKNRNPEVWEMYFPGFTKAPTNKQFIATLAAFLRQKQRPAVSSREKPVRKRRRRKIYYLCPKCVTIYHK